MRRGPTTALLAIEKITPKHQPAKLNGRENHNAKIKNCIRTRDVWPALHNLIAPAAQQHRALATLVPAARCNVQATKNAQNNNECKIVPPCGLPPRAHHPFSRPGSLPGGEREAWMRPRSTSERTPSSTSSGFPKGDSEGRIQRDGGWDGDGWGWGVIYCLR